MEIHKRPRFLGVHQTIRMQATCQRPHNSTKSQLGRTKLPKLRRLQSIPNLASPADLPKTTNGSEALISS
jgi:hypothetical protein